MNEAVGILRRKLESRAPDGEGTKSVGLERSAFIRPGLRPDHEGVLALARRWDEFRSLECRRLDQRRTAAEAEGASATDKNNYARGW